MLPIKSGKKQVILYTSTANQYATDMHVFCQKSTRKLRFCIATVLVFTNMSMTLFRKHFFMEQKKSQRQYRPKIAGILFVCNEPEVKYYTVPSHPLEHC